MSLERVKWPRLPVARYAREDPFAEYCPGLAPGLEPAAGPGRNETPGAAENHRLERELARDPSEKFLSETAEKSAPPPPPSPAEEKKPPPPPAPPRPPKTASKRKKGAPAQEPPARKKRQKKSVFDD